MTGVQTCALPICRDMIENIRQVCRNYKLRSFERARLKGAESADSVDALQQALGLSKRPDIIECVDISNIGGLMAVGSIVCFEKGKAAPRKYRRFRIRGIVDKADDYGMMREVIERRYRRLCDEGEALPDLLVIDGGRGQLNSVLQALHDSRIPPMPVISLAKRDEEIYIPGHEEPFRLPRHHLGLRLIQAARDEAHRFALSYHRTLRRKRISDSVLDEIEGVGPKRREALLKAFGSVTRLKNSSLDEVIERVPGLGLELARRIHSHLQP